jgi:hypothetical protein
VKEGPEVSIVPESYICVIVTSVYLVHLAFKMERVFYQILLFIIVCTASKTTAGRGEGKTSTKGES